MFVQQLASKKVAVTGQGVVIFYDMFAVYVLCVFYDSIQIPEWCILQAINALNNDILYWRVLVQVC